MGVIKGLQLILRNIYGQAAYGKDGESSGDNVQDFIDIKKAVLDGNTKKIIDILENNEKKATPVIIKAVKTAET